MEERERCRSEKKYQKEAARKENLKEAYEKGREELRVQEGGRGKVEN